jgi:hypothetical protein
MRLSGPKARGPKDHDHREKTSISFLLNASAAS